MLTAGGNCLVRRDFLLVLALFSAHCAAGADVAIYALVYQAVIAMA